MTLERQFFTAAELADLALPAMPATKAGVLIRANTENWRAPEAAGVMWRPRIGKGGGTEFHYTLLPNEAIAKLLLLYGPRKRKAEKAEKKSDSKTLWTWFETLPDHRKADARTRLKALLAIETMVSEGGQREMAIAHVANEQKTGKSTLYNWMGRVAGVPRSDWLPFLAPRHAGRTETVECTPAAWDFLLADYLRPSQPQFKACYRRLQEVAVEKGWQIPSSRTLERRIGELPTATLVHMREGDEALKRLHPSQRRDHTVFTALEAVNADGHKWDVFVRWPDGTRGRPMMVSFQDIYSGKILAWRIDKSENKETVRLALGDLVEAWGIPKLCWLDNGRAFTSKWITGRMKHRFRFKVRDEDPMGIMLQLGIEARWATPYHGQAKPIERAHRDFAGDIAKHPAFEGAYTGNNPLDKPENYGLRAVPLETFLDIINQEIIKHNERPGRRSPACRGRSLEETFRESYAQSTPTKATPEQRRMLLLAAEAVTASRADGSLALSGNRYWSEFLNEHRGEKLTIRFDPQHLKQALHVYRFDGAYLGAAACIEDVGFADAEAAQTSARETARLARARREYDKALVRMTPQQVAAALPKTEEAPRPETKVVRMFRGAAALAPRPAPEADEESADEVAYHNALALMNRTQQGPAHLRVVNNPDGDD